MCDVLALAAAIIVSCEPSVRAGPEVSNGHGLIVSLLPVRLVPRSRIVSSPRQHKSIVYTIFCKPHYIVDFAGGIWKSSSPRCVPSRFMNRNPNRATEQASTKTPDLSSGIIKHGGFDRVPPQGNLSAEAQAFVPGTFQGLICCHLPTSPPPLEIRHPCNFHQRSASVPSRRCIRRCTS